MKTELLLTDEFIQFSEKIAKLHVAKKTRQEEFKKVYEAYKVDIKKFDDEAERLNLAFQATQVKSESK